MLHLFMHLLLLLVSVASASNVSLGAGGEQPDDLARPAGLTLRDVMGLVAAIEKIGGKLDNFVDDVNTNIAGLSRVVAGLSTDVAELLDAAPTPRAAALVAAVASETTWLATYVIEKCVHVCSAFAYTRYPGAATAFVSAGHCYDRGGVGLEVTLERPLDARVLLCTVASIAYSDHADDAILDCPGANGLVGLLPAPPNRSILSLPVAAAGFLLDNLSPRRVPESKYALTTMLARVGDAAGSSTCSHTVDEGNSSCSEKRPSILCVAGGFMDRPLTPGMSGGPLMVMQGFVVGISSARGCNSGIFVNLSGVDARLEEAERARALIVI